MMRTQAVIKYNDAASRVLFLYIKSWKVKKDRMEIEKYVWKYRNGIAATNYVFLSLGLVEVDVTNPVGYRATKLLMSLFKSGHRSRIGPEKGDSFQRDIQEIVSKVGGGSSKFVEFPITALFDLGLVRVPASGKLVSSRRLRDLIAKWQSRECVTRATSSRLKGSAVARGGSADANEEKPAL
jgi:hypothetical protein